MFNTTRWRQGPFSKPGLPPRPCLPPRLPEWSIDRINVALRVIINELVKGTMGAYLSGIREGEQVICLSGNYVGVGCSDPT